MTDRDFPLHYILLGHLPVAVDLMTWAKWFETFANRRVAETVIDETPRAVTRGITERRTVMVPSVRVSTVFLGLDHGFGVSDPVLFESMVFGGPLDETQRRYCTWDEASRGHDELVTEARKASAKVKAIARHAGADL
jgi:hypothetical protein